MHPQFCATPGPGYEIIFKNASDFYGYFLYGTNPCADIVFHLKDKFDILQKEKDEELEQSAELNANQQKVNDELQDEL